MRLMQAAIMAALVMTVPLGLSACQKKQTRPDTGAPTTPRDDTSTTGVEGQTGGAASDMSTAQQQDLAQLKQRSTIYFDYDSSEIRAEFLQVIAAHAAYLAKYPNARVRLEGHTDERGSREYNIGLGERRAQAVRRALQLQGVNEAQIATVSYGEERPAVAGAAESAYAQNRRVEIVHVQ
jgi:peptidoglycan-associated lipoprotein